MAFGPEGQGGFQRLFLGQDLFLIERCGNDRSGAGIFQAPDAVERCRQGRGARDDGVSERQAKIGRLEVHWPASLAVSARMMLSSCQKGWNRAPSRAAMSS
jgi:hypothetical protein